VADLDRSTGGGLTQRWKEIASGIHARMVAAVLHVGNTPVSASDPLPVTATASALPTGAATAAKQDTGNTSLAAVSTTLGATDGAAVVTDANGTIQQYLRGLVKLIVAKISVLADPVTATPTPYNLTLTDADTEYSQALPANCRGFEFQARTEAAVRFAFVTGKVAGPTAPYMTLKAGDYYSSPPLNQGASPSTLYLASATAGTVVEILAWT
jgi:hypothetical protein